MALQSLLHCRFLHTMFSTTREARMAARPISIQLQMTLRSLSMMRKRTLICMQSSMRLIKAWHVDGSTLSETANPSLIFSSQLYLIQRASTHLNSCKYPSRENGSCLQFFRIPSGSIGAFAGNPSTIPWRFGLALHIPVMCLCLRLSWLEKERRAMMECPSVSMHLISDGVGGYG